MPAFNKFDMIGYVFKWPTESYSQVFIADLSNNPFYYLNCNVKIKKNLYLVIHAINAIIETQKSPLSHV